MRKKLTNDVVDERLKGRNIKRLDDFITVETKIRWQCLVDDFIWKSTPFNILNNKSGCPICSGWSELTNELIDERLKGRNIKRIDNVIKAITKIRWQCEIDGYIWQSTPNNILNNNTGCPRCSGTQRLTNELVDERIKGRSIKRLDDIVDSHTKIKWQCLKDGYIWETIPSHILHNNSGCPKCYGNVKLTNEFVDNKIKDRNIKRVDDVKGAHTKIKWQCLKHSHIWSATTANILYGKGCPKCNRSKGELFISKFLISNNFCFIEQAKFDGCVNIHQLPFDFFIPKKKVLIEFDGRQHFVSIKHFGGIDSLNKVIKNDSIKSNWAKNNGYHLIRLAHDMTEEEQLLALNQIHNYEDAS